MYNNVNTTNKVIKLNRSKTMRRPSTTGLAVLILLGACSSPVSVEAVPTETITVVLSGRDCLTREIGEVCITRSDASVGVEASGLAPGSALTFTGQDGTTVDFDIAADESLVTDVAGQVVDRSFSVDGEWADGQDLSLTVLFGG